MADTYIVLQNLLSGTGTSGTDTFINLSSLGTSGAAPTIATVSQNAGTIDGATAVSVTGTGFQVGMTSALGTVSAITSSTCTITTGAQSAGAFTWTVTTSSGSAANQTFTYLAHPGTPSIAPTSGPDNATQAATFTSTSLPFGFTGVPFSVTVGGLTVTSLTATASTTATGTIPSGGADGTANVVVSVDGKTATGSGIYTFQAPPTLTFTAPNFGSAAGGWTIKLTGTNFTGATAVTINGVACTSVVVNSATQITCVTPSFGNANGSTTGQTVAVTTPGGTVSSATTNTNYFYLPSNTSFAWAHRADCNVTIATGVSNLGDISPNGVAWTQGTGANQPTVITNYNGSGINGMLFDGTASKMANSFSAISGPISMYAVMRLLAFPTSRDMFKFGAAAAYSGSVRASSAIGKFFLASGSGNRTNGVVAVDTTTVHVHGGVVNGASSFYHIDSTNDTGTVTQVSCTTAQLGFDGTTVFTNMNYGCDIVYNGAVSSADDTTIRSILKTIYGTP